MLCRLQEALPAGDGWLYEPKWDGFRGLLYKHGESTRLFSRNGKHLTRYFPGIVTGAASLPDCILDGEIVAARKGRQDFELLQQVLAGSRVPAAFVAFDLLAQDGQDLMVKPFADRRRALEALNPSADVIQICSQTDNLDLAEVWLHDLAPFGFEGVVAKRAMLPYRSGERSMIKVKHWDTADLVVGGYTGPAGDPHGLLLGAYDAQHRLHHVGATGYLSAPVRRQVAALQPLVDRRSFTGRQPGRSRWQSGRYDTWTEIDPLFVAEVAFNRIDSGQFRHAGRFLQWRLDKDPQDCLVSSLKLCNTTGMESLNAGRG